MVVCIIDIMVNATYEFRCSPRFPAYILQEKALYAFVFLTTLVETSREVLHVRERTVGAASLMKWRGCLLPGSTGGPLVLPC